MVLLKSLFLLVAVLVIVTQGGEWPCNKPQITNGFIHRFPYHSYPIRSGEISYTCHGGYGSTDDGRWRYSKCTRNGWDPEPKCLRVCLTPQGMVPHADYGNPDYEDAFLVDGGSLTFTCHPGYKTYDGETTGEIKCLPDGQMSTSRCSRMCPALPELSNGIYKMERSMFFSGQHVIYECEEEFVSANGRRDGRSLCTGDTWHPPPHCKEIFCTLNSNSTQFHFRSDDVVYLKCPEGTTMEGSDSSQCYYFGWSPALPVCRDADFQDISPLIDVDKTEGSGCPPAAAPPNADIIDKKDHYSDGERMKVVCHPGYRLLGSGRVLCEDGKWHAMPYCEELLCQLTAPTIKNGTIDEESVAEKYYTGSVVKYHCDKGYHPSGIDQSRCVNQEWIPKPSCVEDSCGKPLEIEHGYVLEAQAEYQHGERVSYECWKGYELFDRRDTTCLYGIWKNISKCVERIKCASPQIENGEIHPDTLAEQYYAGDSMRYRCHEGYHINGSEKSTCQNGEWQPFQACVENPCGKAVEIENGNIRDSQTEYKHGQNASYECAPGYKLSSDSAAICFLGKWQNVPECVDVSCGPPPYIEHGKAKGPPKLRYLPGDRVYYGCSPGYSVGPRVNHISCQDTLWTNPPSCRRVGRE